MINKYYIWIVKLPIHDKHFKTPSQWIGYISKVAYLLAEAA